MSTYTTTDLHGNYEIWTEIKNILKPEDKLIYLGDAIDRGNRGYEISREMLDDERVTYLRGNHEQLMIDAFKNSSNLSSWTREENGGQQTLQNIYACGLTIEERFAYIDKINALPYFTWYESKQGIKFFLSHSGTTLGYYFNMLMEKDIEAACLWDREHFYMPWTKDETYKNVVAVHGHTPILAMKQFGFKNVAGVAPLIYENNHKINLDAATPCSNFAFLYNLDTLEHQIIKSV